jgi:hypothetical protein
VPVEGLEHQMTKMMKRVYRVMKMKKKRKKPGDLSLEKRKRKTLGL